METCDRESDISAGGINNERASLAAMCRPLIEHAPQPMVAVEGARHLVRYANPSFCRLAKRDSEELVDCPFAEAVPESGENGCGSLIDRVLTTGNTEELIEQEHAYSDDGPEYWSYFAWPVRDIENKTVGVMIQVTDATETVLYRRQVTAMNEELLLSGIRQHELRDAAERLNFRLQRSIRETHHRVKNNLQVVVALAEMQVEGKDAMLPASALERIMSHVRTLASLHDLLIQRVSLNTEADTLPTLTMLERIILLLQPTFGKRQITYEIAQLTLPMSQSTALSLLMSELISNGFKHGEKDINVSFTFDKGRACLRVCDQGQGFPADFDPREAAHTGLDLIMSMARHDLRGEVTFTNRPEGGGCVAVMFPVKLNE